MAGEKHATIIDLAAGTGKLTEALAARDEEYQIIAVEPHADMRDVLAKKKLKGVTVVDGLGDSMPSIDDESVDAVTVAQVGGTIYRVCSSSRAEWNARYNVPQRVILTSSHSDTAR